MVTFTKEEFHTAGVDLLQAFGKEKLGAFTQKMAHEITEDLGFFARSDDIAFYDAAAMGCQIGLQIAKNRADEKFFEAISDT